MREWTREERYRKLKNADELQKLYEKKKESEYQQKFHIQPMTGLLNDPNGFCYYDNQWHMFYQWCPWGAVHGIKHWYHVTSKDLLHWNNQGCALSPDMPEDNKGVFSGSAYIEDGELYLFYTGNHRDENWVRTPYVCLAKIDKDGTFKKKKKSLISKNPAYTENQRDPKIVYVEEKKKYYIFLGAQTKKEQGCIIVYESEKLTDNWKFLGQLKVPGFENFGKMWECPCLETIDGKDVLIFSPQYLKLPKRGENIFHNVYLIGQMDYDTLTFVPETDYQFLDYGFDFYAAQTAAVTDKKGRSILCAWVGLPENHYPSEEKDWEGSLTLIRELHINKGKLWQLPTSGIEALRRKQRTEDGVLPKYGELILKNDGGNLQLTLFGKKEEEGGIRIFYDAETKSCIVNRSGLEKKMNEQWGNELTFTLEDNLRNLRIFIDGCSMEMFVNEGEAVFTMHIFPTKEEKYLFIHGNAMVQSWDYKESITDNLIL